MRTAILSDIHGNLDALQCVLADLQTRHIDRIMGLGDLVDGGFFNVEVIELMQDLKIPTVQGNHDVFNDCNLPDYHQNWLNDLPQDITEAEICFTHISPRRGRNKISDRVEAWNVFSETTQRLCFIGHLHYPVLYGSRCEFFGESHGYDIDQGAYPLDPDDRYVICFGAIGYPRGGGAFIRYGIYDDRTHSLEFIKLEGYLLPYGS
jgi:predicted phosphodiesterase